MIVDAARPAARIPLNRQQPVSINHAFLRRLRILSIIEGVSTLVLFGIAMPMKYVWETPMAVTIVGSVHGILFMAVVAMFVLAIWRVPIAPRLAVVGIGGAIVPFGPFIVDRWLHRVAVSDAAAVSARSSAAPAAGPPSERRG